MNADTGRTKAAVGAVGVDERQGKLRIRLPRSVAKDAARYITTRLDATPENLKRVQVVAWAIEDDIKNGNFDTTLERYVAAFKPKLAIIKLPQEPDLLTLWDAYTEHMRSQVAETTFIKEYTKKFSNHIKKLPIKDISKAAEITEFLLRTTSADTAKRVITRLSACCNWGVKSGLLKTNPFLGMAADIKLKKNYTEQIDPFSLAERNAIIEAFASHPTHKHYYPFVRFLFLTGCRTGEAIGLQWKHISHDCTQITFSESYDSNLKIRKDTKTGKARRFPCNNTLKELLLSIRPTDVPLAELAETLVFKSPTGLPINNSKFTNQVWKGCKAGKKTYHGVIPGLVAAGKVERYRPPYNTRHTFITMALEAGMTAPQVAKLVGNSPEVIMRHYAGNVLKFDVPVV